MKTRNLLANFRIPQRTPSVRSGLLETLPDALPAMPAVMQILEVTDDRDRPLMVMQPESVHRQRLHSRMVCVAVRSRQGKIILHKGSEPSAGQPGCWDVFSGFPLVGEAREDAAARILQSLTGLTLAVRLTARKLGDPVNPEHLSLYRARLPKGIMPERDPGEILAVDEDELEGLTQDAPDLLAPTLLWAFGTGLLFGTDG